MMVRGTEATLAATLGVGGRAGGALGPLDEQPLVGALGGLPSLVEEEAMAVWPAGGEALTEAGHWQQLGPRQWRACDDGGKGTVNCSEEPRIGQVL
jgi:hypothetical protein